MTFKYPEYSALFNIFENEKSYDDLTEVTSISFGPTMKMSPYLLAFVISDYQIDSAQGQGSPDFGRSGSGSEHRPGSADILDRTQRSVVVGANGPVIPEQGYSPETHTLIRVPGPDYIMKDNLGDYAVEASMKIIDGFSRYFGKDYTDAFEGMSLVDGYDTPAKSDQIGIPDFAAGAMENWGLGSFSNWNRI